MLLRAVPDSAWHLDDLSVAPLAAVAGDLAEVGRHGERADLDSLAIGEMPCDFPIQVDPAAHRMRNR